LIYFDDSAFLIAEDTYNRKSQVDFKV